VIPEIDFFMFISRVIPDQSVFEGILAVIFLDSGNQLRYALMTVSHKLVLAIVFLYLP